MAERDAAKAVLTSLQFDHLLANKSTVLPSFATPPAHLAHSRQDTTGQPSSGTLGGNEQVRPCGGVHNDTLGVLTVALDAAAVPVVIPGDRIATTILFASEGSGATTEALQQRAMHRHTRILQVAEFL